MMKILKALPNIGSLIYVGDDDDDDDDDDVKVRDHFHITGKYKGSTHIGYHYQHLIKSENQLYLIT